MFYNFIFTCLDKMEKCAKVNHYCASFTNRPQFKARCVLMGLRRLIILRQCKDNLVQHLLPRLLPAKRGCHLK